MQDGLLGKARSEDLSEDGSTQAVTYRNKIVPITNGGICIVRQISTATTR